MKKTFRLIKKICLAVMVIVLCVFSFVASPTSPISNSVNKITLSADAWNSNLAEIDKIESQNLTQYISIKTLLTLDADELVVSVANPNTITNNSIIMLNDGLDVYYFSEICNPTFANNTENPYYKTYLTLNYTLGADINYEDASKTFKMLRPIGWREPFSGTFDARGYTISNIFFRPFDNAEEIQQSYPELVYVSWFSQNNGTIKNLGIINPNMIQYSLYEPSVFASPFVGDNLGNGVIENCYVQDLRKQEAGLSAEGGYDISMFMSDNSGTVRNSYVACDRITSSSITITSAKNRHPFCNGNSGTIENCYYDSETLVTQGQTYVEEPYSGLTALKTAQFLTDDFSYNDDSGNFEGIWFSNYTYPVTHASYLKLNYPILKGFEKTTINSTEYFIIENIVDFIYLSELIENYQPFRSSSYLLTNSIDLKSVKEDAYVFSQAVFSGTLKSGYKTNNGYTTTYSDDVQFNDNYSITLADGIVSKYNSIINLDINRGNSYNGYNCYGLFSILAGNVENINIVNSTITLAGIETLNEYEINSIGTVCGLLEGGRIENVNIYSDIYLSKEKSSTSTFLGSNYVGGICGTATAGVISNCTTNGKINQISYTTLGNESHEHSIGGILGKALNNDGVTNCLNNMDISAIEYQTTKPNDANRQYIGGVIGSGEINNATQLQNNAEINVGRSGITSTYYTQSYVGGVIGKVSSVKGNNGLYLNNANINYYVNDNNYKAYISGVMNVISSTSDKYDSFNITLNAQNVQSELANQSPFEFTSISNAGLLNIENDLTTSKYPAKYGVFTTITNGIDIRSAGICYSYLTNMNILGAYNLNYHYERSVNGNIIQQPNESQNIDISMIDKYAPTFNADNKLYYLNNQLHIDTVLINSRVAAQTLKHTTPELHTSISLKRVYNFNQTNYITNKAVNMFNLQLSGCINGRNFNLENIRNDGNVNVYFSKATNGFKFGNNTYKNYFGAQDKTLKVFGVFEEVSLDHRAKDIYNGGNVTISSDNKNNIVPNFTLYASGICYKNVGNDKPKSTGTLIEKGYIGSLHNCINNGEIRLTRGDIINATSKITEPGDFYGGVRLAGITSINASTISQTFNLGDVYNINQVYDNENSDYGTFSAASELEVETGGFCFVMQNEVYDIINGVEQVTSANIIDSANNGVIVSMNTGNQPSFTNAGGFVARNDRGEEGNLIVEDNGGQTNSVSRESHKIKIQYSINYGDIYAYNGYTNVIYAGEQQSKAAGIICLGACTIVDVINYGNIYGNSVASGIFGYLYIRRMNNGGMGEDSPIYISNSINYGNAQIIAVSDNTNNNISKISNIGTTNESVTTRTVANNTNNSARLYVAGALIGVWGHGQTVEDLQAMQIKYLVNFCDTLDILGWNYNSNYNNADTYKEAMMRNMATTKSADTSPAPFDTDTTAPYSYGIRCYTKDTAAPNDSVAETYSQAHNGGIFNENYSLRKPGELTYDENGNIDLNNTDNFIADYIQFVPYSKVNDYLVEKIGLKSTVLSNAYENALVNSALIKQVLLAKYNGSEIKDIYDTVLTKYNSSLDQKKTIISETIFSYLKEHPEYADDIALELLNDDSVFSSILDTSDVKSILAKVIRNLKDEDKDLIIEIFNNLINTDTFETLVDGMTNQQKDQILTQIFDLVKDDPEVLEVISSKIYEDLDLSTEEDLQKLLDPVISEGLTQNANPSYPITKDEYTNMYLSTVLNTITTANLTTFVNNLQAALTRNGANYNQAVYNFVESGRSASNGIYLPVTEDNYLAYVNSTNYLYGGNTGTKTNQQSYTGTVMDINGTLPDASHYELYISEGYFTSGRTRVGWRLRNGTYYDFTTGNNATYDISYRNATTNGYRAWPSGISTGVYISVIETDSVRVNYQTINDALFRIENMYTLGYIDYGSGAVDKNTGNNTTLAYTMVTEMRNLVATNPNKVKEYLMNIYANSTEDSAAFLALIPNTNNVNNMTSVEIAQAIINNMNTYLNGNTVDDATTKSYIDTILDNISNPTARANIVKLFLTNPTDYDAALAEMIKALDSSNNSHYQAIKNILPILFTNCFGGVSSSDKVSIAQDLINIANTNGLLNTNDYMAIVKQSLIADIGNLSNVLSTINDTELYAEIAGIIISGNATDFENYTGLNEDNIITELEELGIDSSMVTDFTGIYALASSLGIEAGLFLPDNIQLIGMDYYYTDEDGKETNDPSWRGGTSDEPNSYDENDTEKVNYKVYYEMKQLKKSIATIIFEMELTDDNGNIITNNIETDYYCGYKEKQPDGTYIVRNEIHYYIPINHDILMSDYIYVNTADGSYELSYGATFDEANELKVTVPDVNTSLSVGDILTDTFIVQAEDITVKTTYTVMITITESSYLNFILDNNNDFNISIDGNESEVTYETKEIYPGIVVAKDVAATTSVKGYNGIIRLTLRTNNMMNKLNLLENVNVYQANNDGQDLEYDGQKYKQLVLNEGYKFNDETNNGIVVIPGESGTGFNTNTNGFNPGTVFFNLSLSNELRAGKFLIEIVLNSQYSYYLLVEKDPSDYAMVESITYNNQEFDNDGSTSNEDEASTHEYGKLISEEELYGSYFDELIISPLSTYKITNAVVVENGGYKQYQITYLVTAEDGKSTFEFVHYINEEHYATHINNIFYNGGVLREGPIEKDQNSDYIFMDSFEKNETPSYRFDYQLSEFHLEEGVELFKVNAYDHNNNLLSDEVLAEYMNIIVNDGVGFEINFMHEAISEIYYFELEYNNSYNFNNNTVLEWDVVFDRIMIQKLKNRNSYLDNATFLSESVVSSIRTMVDIDEITIDEYKEMLIYPTRKIMCLPGQIHYNEYSYSFDSSTDTITKEDDFYVIGLVNKTQLDWYTPTFTLPEGAKIYRTKMVDDEIYRYVPYYVDDVNEITAFLVNEDNTIFKTEAGDSITITGDVNRFTYTDTEYILSPVSGLQTIDYNGTTIVNTTLYTNYNEYGCFKEGPNGEEDGYFEYVHYRVYAEIYGDDAVQGKESDYYTDYFIATQDLTNNIRFNIIIDKVAGCDINTKVYNVYAEFVCYQFIGSEENPVVRDENYELYNRAGIFGYFKNESIDDVVVAEHITLQSNTSGWYSIYVALPDGYTYTYRFEDKGASEIYKEGQEFHVESSITARTITLHITITNDDLESNDDWGVKVEDETFIKDNN